MRRLSITVAEIARDFEVRVYTGCDGYPTSRCFPVVHVTTAEGEFFLPNAKGAPRTDEDDWGMCPVIESYNADVMVKKVEAKGSIDPQYWVKVDPNDHDLESILEAEYERECFEKGMHY
jgi:hypothetical protein